MAPWIGPMFALLLGGGVGIPFDELGETDPDRSPAIGYVRPRVQFTWEKAPLEYGEPGSRRKRTSLVPELEVGAVVGGDGWDVSVGGGVKLQGDFAVHRAGMFGLSMRGGGYVALRGAVLADGSLTPLGEIAFGGHLWWGPRRFVYEASFGVLGREGDAELTAMMALGVGWAP